MISSTVLHATDDEAALVAAARGGDTSCFEMLVSRYERRIFRLAKNITQNDSDAEDVMQEAFLKAFEHLANFRGNSRFYTWLVRITINQAVMTLRKRRHNQVSLDDPIDIGEDFLPREIEDWGPTPEQQYAQSELADLLSGAIASLPPGLRVVFQLRDVENLSTDETANLLGLSVLAVKSRLLRARLELREKLNPFLRKGARCSTALFRTAAQAHAPGPVLSTPTRSTVEGIKVPSRGSLPCDSGKHMEQRSAACPSSREMSTRLL